MGIIAKYDCEVVNTVSMAGEVIAVVVDVSSAEEPSLTMEISADGLSSYIEHRMKVQAQFVPNDPYWSLQWGPQKIGADWAWNTTIGDPSVLVAVIDTGIDWDHPDLVANYVALGYDWVNNDKDPMDDNGHGTHCAGIIAAVTNNSIGVAGLAQVRIMAEKGIDQYGQGYEDDLANAIIHAVDQGADILSNSWGGYGESALIHEAIKYAYDSGVLVVAAAGNDDTNTRLYPAAYDEVIAVVAADQYDGRPWWTNYGEWVELAAPGVNILSTVWNDSYSYMSGTSMACPNVAGIAALILSQFPNLTRDQLRYLLRDSVDDLGNPGFDIYYGYGRVNARKAVERVLQDHDLLIFELEKPLRLKPRNIAVINVTVLNFGMSHESDVTVHQFINSSLVNSAVISFLKSGESATLSFSYNLTIEGTYNLTSYVVPVPGETIIKNNALSKYLTVGETLKVPQDYPTIRYALEMACPGDTIEVAAGTYYENLIIDKADLTLIGEDPRRTTVVGSEEWFIPPPVVLIRADHINIKRFTIQGPLSGIELESSKGCTLRDNIVTCYGLSIGLFNCTGIIISGNKLSVNASSGSCIELWDSNSNIISENTFLFGAVGVILRHSNNNIICHNNFFNNTCQMHMINSCNNMWDVGYPFGGNYWSDYTGVDLYSGPYQNETGSDGTGDTPYIIDGNNTDRYPLMKAWKWPILGDINYDFKVDIKDFVLFVKAFGSTPTHPRWKPEADLNNDYKVDIKDLVLVIKHFGEHYP
jgi:thermitase